MRRSLLVNFIIFNQEIHEINILGGRNFEHKEIGIKNSDYRTQLLGFKNTIFSIPVGLKNTLFFE